jgi:hypothetical protein
MSRVLAPYAATATSPPTGATTSPKNDNESTHPATPTASSRGRMTSLQGSQGHRIGTSAPGPNTRPGPEPIGVHLVTYQYTCDNDGPTEVNLPMGTATESIPCPACNQLARRVFSRPMVSTVDQTSMRIINSAEATSDRPEVVTSVPSTGRRRRQPMAPPNPMLRKLPRP